LLGGETLLRLRGRQVRLADVRLVGRTLGAPGAASAVLERASPERCPGRLRPCRRRRFRAVATGEAPPVAQAAAGPGPETILVLGCSARVPAPEGAAVSVFTEGPTALIVSSALDPDVTLDRFAQKGFQPRLWVAKLTGEDTGAEYDIRHAFERARARGLRVGGWIQLSWSPQRDIASLEPWFDKEDFDVLELAAEVEYKSNYEQGDVYRAD